MKLSVTFGFGFYLNDCAVSNEPVAWRFCFFISPNVVLIRLPGQDLLMSYFGENQGFSVDTLKFLS